MVGVNPYRVSSVEAKPAPVSFQIANATEFGQARETAVAAENLMRGADSVGRLAEEMLKDRNARNEAARQAAANLAAEARVQDVNNGIIAAHDTELRSGNDAFLNKRGAAAIAAAPEKLDALKTATLARENLTPPVRARLAPILDAHLVGARETVERHVVEQLAAYERGVAQRAIDLLRQQASLDSVGRHRPPTRRPSAAEGPCFKQTASTGREKIPRRSLRRAKSRGSG